MPLAQVTQPPAQPNVPNGPPPTGSFAPAGNEPQATQPTPGIINPLVNSPEAHGPAPPATNHTPQSQADKIHALKARLECYEKDGTTSASDHSLQVLFADQDTINCAKAASAPSKEDGKKPILPDVVPGFKASSLEVGKPLHFLH